MGGAASRIPRGHGGIQAVPPAHNTSADFAHAGGTFKPAPALVGAAVERSVSHITGSFMARDRASADKSGGTDRVARDADEKGGENTTARSRRRRIDDLLDDALEETFPASDPVSVTQPHPHHRNGN